MTTEERLVLLKKNIQTLTDANDDYLTFLLEEAVLSMKETGLRDDGSKLYDSVVIDYAAYKWRKRDVDTSDGMTGATAMPRFLKRTINKMLFNQKIREGSS